MSKLLTLLFSIVFLVLIGGFIYLATVDVPIAQEKVTKETTLYEIQQRGDQ